MASISQALASLSAGLKEDRLSKRDDMQFALGLMQFQSERQWREEESKRQQFAANITMLEADNQKHRKRHASQLINDLANISGTPLIIGNENVESNFEDWQKDFIEAWNPNETEELKYEAGELISLIYNYRLNPDSDAATEDILTHGRMMFQRYLSVTEGHREDPIVEAYAKSGLFGRTYMMKNAEGNYVRDTDLEMEKESKRFYHNLMVTEDLQYKLAQERTEFVTAGDTQIQSDVSGYKGPGQTVSDQDYFSEEDYAAFSDQLAAQDVSGKDNVIGANKEISALQKKLDALGKVGLGSSDQAFGFQIELKEKEIERNRIINKAKIDETIKQSLEDLQNAAKITGIPLKDLKAEKESRLARINPYTPPEQLGSVKVPWGEIVVGGKKGKFTGKQL